MSLLEAYVSTSPSYAVWSPSYIDMNLPEIDWLPVVISVKKVSAMAPVKASAIASAMALVKTIKKVKVTPKMKRLQAEEDEEDSITSRRLHPSLLKIQ